MTMGGSARVILVANQKGGVGKSTTVAAIAEMIATGGRRGGRKVLVIDGDPQGTVSRTDLGAPSDSGASLAQTLQYGSPLQPQRDVRPNLDVIPGGPNLSIVGAAAYAMVEAGVNMAANFERSLQQLCDQEQYELVLIDSAPGDVPLLDTFLAVANYLIIPTKSDRGSQDGVALLAQRFWRVRKAGALINLLGVVLFDVDRSATRRNQDTIEQISEMLEGSGVEPFGAVIRHLEGAAVDMRNLAVTAGELPALANADKKERLARLRKKERPERGMWSSDPSGVAADYQELVYEMIKRLARYEADNTDIAIVGA
ncbi:ParA family protein [Mycobacterium sp. 155]|uniref:ParA family protein n=1 Tax=Mycobacterium sp. 155 TaxID=1157943 RepID=UPI0004764A30|nr:ParA family protein [Mycobacterium sp. 155]